MHNHNLVLSTMRGERMTVIPHHNAFNTDFIANWQAERQTFVHPEDYYNLACAIVLGNECFSISSCDISIANYECYHDLIVKFNAGA